SEAEPSGRERHPGEAPKRHRQARDGPDREYQQVVRRDPGAFGGRVEGLEQGAVEVADGKYVGDIAKRARELRARYEDARDEVQRQDDRLDDRLGGVLGAD